MPSKDFEQYVRQQCKYLNLSLTEVAKQSDMSRPNLYKLMSGNAENARLSTLVKLANVLETHPQILLRHMFEHTDISPLTLPSILHTHDGSGFIADVSIPDNTQVTQSQTFIKTWKIQNTGAIEWTERFLVCVDNQITITQKTANFDIPAFKRGLIPTENSVAIANLLPGETTEISIEFTAPSVPGSCISYWKMADREGNLCFPKLEGLSCQVQVLYL